MAERQPLTTFHVLLPEIRLPQRADRSAGGLLPTRAFRYCEAVTTASAFGYYVFPPIGIDLLWDGSCVHWTYDGAGEWMPLVRAQFPGFADRFDQDAPEPIKGYSPPFLAALPEPGVVQIWSGLMVRTLPGWSMLLRAPANLPRAAGYELFEGIVETDRWFGPLFTNIRLTKTDQPVRLDPEMPLFQAQPLQRATYAEESLNDYECVLGASAFTGQDWERYRATVVKDAPAEARPMGADAGEVRRRRRAEVSESPAG